MVWFPEIVTHNQNDVNIAGSRLAGDVAAKHNKALELSSALGHPVDTDQPGGNVLALLCAVSEALDSRIECSAMNTVGQIAFAVEFRLRHLTKTSKTPNQIDILLCAVQ